MPPVDVVFSKELACESRTMFRIIVLHKSMLTVGQFLIDKGDEGFFEDLCVKLGIHYSTKYEYWSSPLFANTCPDVYFD